MKYLLRSIALSLLWLSVGLACKKEDLSPKYCDDGTCCTPTTEKYELAGRVEGVAAGFDDEVTVSMDAKFPANVTCFASVASVCDLSRYKTKGVKISQNLVSPEHRYRVWGTVYYRLVQTFTCRPVLVINIERVEEIK